MNRIACLHFLSNRKTLVKQQIHIDIIITGHNAPSHAAHNFIER